MTGKPAASFTPAEKQKIFIRRTQEKFPAVWQAYCDMVAHDKFSADELHDYNFRQRLEILKYAYENTVFYRRLYDSAGVRPDDVKTEDDWDHLPIVTKDEEMVKRIFAEYSGVKVLLLDSAVILGVAVVAVAIDQIRIWVWKLVCANARKTFLNIGIDCFKV